MNRLARTGMVLWAIGLGVFAAALSVASVNAAITTADQVDLAITINTPDHVAVDENFTANIAYENVGTAIAPDGRVTATLPSGTQFVTSTDRLGVALPPALIDGAVIAWNVGSLPAASCCGHILLTLHTALTICRKAHC